MLYRDVRRIESDNNTCNVIVNASTVYGFKNNNQTRNTYVLIEDKYFKTSTDNNNFGYNISSYTCLSHEDLAALTSPANAYVPFYSFVALILCVLSLWLVWFAVKSIFGRRV